MKNIAIISSSVRNGRSSHRVALYFENFLKENKLANTKLLDLKSYNFPIFEERLSNLNPAPTGAEAFSQEIIAADGVIIVTPEYNGGYPASLKNVVDLLYKEWKHKPIAISTVSAGSFAGSQVITSLQFSLWKIGALTVPSQFPVPTVDKTFNADGTPVDRETTSKRALTFITELLSIIELKEKSNNNQI